MIDCNLPTESERAREREREIKHESKRATAREQEQERRCEREAFFVLNSTGTSSHISVSHANSITIYLATSIK